MVKKRANDAIYQLYVEEAVAGMVKGPQKEMFKNALNSNPMPFFVAHELMHCMGLHHSFDNNSLHTFKIGQTENIMDYSHIPTYAVPNGTLTQISTWKWQWDILKNSNEKET
jgi:hypothetical protein